MAQGSIGTCEIGGRSRGLNGSCCAPRWSWRNVVFISCAAFASLLAASSADAQPSRPNIILIIGDDLGWPDYGFMPSSRTLETNQGTLPINQIVQTPNLDALAAGGVVFPNTFVTGSSCIPSLKTLLTGLQPIQWAETRTALDALPQITLSPAPFLYPRVEVEHLRTLPKDLGGVGYKSWEGGKFWEGTYDLAGFTHGLTVSHGQYIVPHSWEFGRAGWDPELCGADGDPNVPCPALDPLREFFDEVEGNPFFVWFAPTLPHTPFAAPQNFLDPYEALGLTSCATVSCWNRCAGCPNEVNYLANITWLDSLVGELIDELESRELRNDTLLIYLADNGWGLGFQTFSGMGKGKNTLYDLGFRTPMIFNWPGHVPTGVVHQDLASAVDVVPTIMDYVGIDVPPELQGQSLRQRVEGGPSLGRTEVIGLHEGIGHFLRTDTWRYLRFASDGHEELYQIDIDPFEFDDVAAQHPQLVAQFAGMVDAWEAAQRTPPERVEITGRLLHPTTNAPLTGSHLRLENGPIDLVSIVGSDGSFRFGPIDSGNYVVRAGHNTMSLEWLGNIQPVPATVPLGSGGSYLNLTGTQPLPLEGPVGAQIRGVLTDEGGMPLPDVPIAVEGVKGCNIIRTQVSTQADGSYRTENLAFTTYTITANPPPGYQDVVVEGVVVDALDVFIQDLVALPE